MARINESTITINGEPIAVAEIDISWVPSGGSQCTLKLLEQQTISVAITDEWTVRLDVSANGAVTGEPSGWPLFVGTPLASRRLRARNENRSITRTNAIVIADRFASFRDYAPAPYAPVTHKGTSFVDELNYVAAQLGIGRAVTNIDNCEIARVDYTIDTGFWGALAPWWSPYEPQVWIDPLRTTELRVMDPSDLDSGMLSPAAACTRSDWASWECVTTRANRVDVVRLSYTPTYGVQGTGPSPALADIDEAIDDDTDATGNEVRITTRTGYTHEDPLDPSKRTRPVPMGVTTEKFRPAKDQDGVLIPGDRRVSKEVTENTYEDDYRRLVTITTVVSGLLDRPFIGRVWTEGMERRVRRVTYRVDPFDIARVIRDKEIETTTGYALLRAQVPAKIATWNGSIDTRPTSTDEVVPGRTLEMQSDTYEPITADQHIVHHRVWDKLKELQIASSDKTVTGRSSITLDQQPILEWIPPNPTPPVRRSLPIDASAIGPDLGRRLAARRVAQESQPLREATSVLKVANPGKYRLGRVIPFPDLPYGDAGLYLCVGVTFSKKEASARWVQTLRLTRHW
jgi:hypothetical protein